MPRIRLAALSAAFALSAGTATAAPAPAWVDPSKTKVAILIFNNVEVIDYSGPLEVLDDAGFDVFTVAASKDPVTTSAGDAVKLTAKYRFSDAPQADLIVIPGGGYEAPRDSATAQWIQRQAAHAQHVMSVCNGAITLANTGLLNGLSATTTAGNISRMRQTYPAINVVDDQRVVDNGKIVTTAGLSAGIDGALHMVDVIKGEGAGQSVALQIEYDWQPHSNFVRGSMADRLIPKVYADLAKVGEAVDLSVMGDNDHWETTIWYTSKLATAELLGTVKATFEKAYAAEGPWAAGSFHTASSGPRAVAVQFDDRKNHHWTGTLAVEPVQTNPGQFAVRYDIRREG
jgi:putative intracellular protease/amidase